jgi:hypothetical protein
MDDVIHQSSLWHGYGFKIIMNRRPHSMVDNVEI